jgi:CrcB protein
VSGFLLVCLGAGIGAPARYLTDRFVQSRHDSVLPWGTVAVNVVGSWVLGLLLGLSVHRAVPDPVLLAVGTGLCGALTTYSTFGYETLRLYEDGARLLAALNAGLSLAAGLGAAALGYWLGAAA